MTSGLCSGDNTLHRYRGLDESATTKLATQKVWKCRAPLIYVHLCTSIVLVLPLA
jgi:hypothetical protein